MPTHDLPIVMSLVLRHTPNNTCHSFSARHQSLPASSDSFMHAANALHLGWWSYHNDNTVQTLSIHFYAFPSYITHTIIIASQTICDGTEQANHTIIINESYSRLHHLNCTYTAISEQKISHPQRCTEGRAHTPPPTPASRGLKTNTASSSASEREYNSNECRSMYIPLECTGSHERSIGERCTCVHSPNQSFAAQRSTGGVVERSRSSSPLNAGALATVVVHVVALKLPVCMPAQSNQERQKGMLAETAPDNVTFTVAR